MHYRGSWGVGGTFSFLHCIEDADAEVNFVLDPDNVTKYRIDPNRVVMIGHSMGSLMAASAAARHSRVKAIVLLSAWNIGASRLNDLDEAKLLASGENLAPIVGADGLTLAHEELTYRSELDMQRLAPALATTRVMMTTANDHSDQFAIPFAAALRVAGNSKTKMIHFDTDHGYSAKRRELSNAIMAFLSQ